LKGSFGSEVSVTLNDTFPPPPAAAPPLAIFLLCWDFGNGPERDLTALYIRTACVGRVLRNLNAALRNVRRMGRTLPLPQVYI
jgi:hypothetical protein